MNKLYFTLILVILTSIAQAQNYGVEESTYGIQAGFLGVWVHHESKQSDQITLRSEIGFDSHIWDDYQNEGALFLMTPVLTFEPRWYYNLKKRRNNLKPIEGNSGNFLSLKASYHPSWFVITNKKNASIISDFSLIPTWGIRRSIGKHFTFETGIGIGYKYLFAKREGFAENKSDTAFNLHLRMGYSF